MNAKEFIELIEPVLPFLSGLVGAIIVLIGNNYIVNKKEKNLENEMRKQIMIYEYRTSTMLQSLKFLENYIASTFESEAVFENISVKELTFEARQCLDRLIIYFDKGELANSFKDIIIKKGTISSAELISKYNKFRNLCREELGFERIVLNNDMFYAFIKTHGIQK